jgi:hypothetical protein
LCGAAPKQQEPRRRTSIDPEGFVRSTKAEEPRRSIDDARNINEANNTKAGPRRSPEARRSTESTAEEARRSTKSTAKGK